jgi:hypothetical protein
MTSPAIEVQAAYLQATTFCDSEHPAIRQQAQELTRDTASDREAALKIFKFVRDGILFGADYYLAQASDTLAHGIGFCVTKTNLQIALLRAAGIPARYHQVTARREALKGIVADFAYNFLPAELDHHPWGECYLDGEWLACECLFDKDLYEKALAKRLFTQEQIPTIDWDGESDLLLLEPWIVTDHGTLASYDDVIRQAHREQGVELIGRIGRHFSNRYTHRVRIG